MAKSRRLRRRVALWLTAENLHLNTHRGVLRAGSQANANSPNSNKVQEAKAEAAAWDASPAVEMGTIGKASLPAHLLRSQPQEIPFPSRTSFTTSSPIDAHLDARTGAAPVYTM